MSCKCEERNKPATDRNWAIIDHKCNYSTFTGGRKVYSDYSSVTCLRCGTTWRTKAGFVDQLAFDKKFWRNTK